MSERMLSRVLSRWVVKGAFFAFFASIASTRHAPWRQTSALAGIGADLGQWRAR